MCFYGIIVLWWSIVALIITDCDYHGIINCKELDGLKCWGQLAESLGLLTDRVKNIVSSNSEAQKSEFAHEWLRHEKSPSWDKLIVALRSIEMHRTAVRVLKNYSVSPGKGEYTCIAWHCLIIELGFISKSVPSGYLPILHYDFLRIRNDETIIFQNVKKGHSSRLDPGNFKHCTLPADIQEFAVLIHLRWDQ